VKTAGGKTFAGQQKEDQIKAASTVCESQLVLEGKEENTSRSKTNDGGQTLSTLSKRPAKVERQEVNG
jgi:hypothetical protein